MPSAETQGTEETSACCSPLARALLGRREDLVVWQPDPARREALGVRLGARGKRSYLEPAREACKPRAASQLAMRDEIQRRVNSVLSPEKVERVYFTSFVVQ